MIKPNNSDDVIADSKDIQETGGVDKKQLSMTKSAIAARARRALERKLEHEKIQEAFRRMTSKDGEMRALMKAEQDNRLERWVISVGEKILNVNLQLDKHQALISSGATYLGVGTILWKDRSGLFYIKPSGKVRSVEKIAPSWKKYIGTESDPTWKPILLWISLFASDMVLSETEILSVTNTTETSNVYHTPLGDIFIEVDEKYAWH